MSRHESTLSIRRFVELLELFEQRRRPLPSAEITAALQAPRSSTAALLRNLVELGVLSLDRRSATYLPTIHFAALSEWVRSSWLPDGEFLQRLAALREETDETISLWTAADLHMEVLHVVEGVTPLSLRLRAGQRFNMPFSAVGAAYLASLPAGSRATLARRLEQHAREHGQRFDTRQLRQAVREAAQRGHATVMGGVIPEVGAVAVPVPARSAPRPLVVSVGGLGSRIRAQEAALVRMLKRFAAA